MSMCPCRSGDAYGACCEPVHRQGAGLGTTAEQLMRARYSAYVLQDASFLLRSWHPDTRPSGIDFPADQRWQGLTVISTTAGGGLESEGTVEFTAQWRRGDDDFELHERSSFVRVKGQWLYLDGVRAS